MKLLAFAVLLLVAQGTLAKPNPLFSSLISSVTGIVNKTVTAATTLVSGAVSTATNTVSNIVGDVSDATLAAETAVVSTISSTIPGVTDLVSTVTNTTQELSNIKPITLLSDITNIVTAAKSGSTANVINAVLETFNLGDVINNTVIQLPINADGSAIGNLTSEISNALNKASTSLQSIISVVNQTFTKITDAAEDFVTDGIGALNPAPGSVCWTAVNQAKQNFVQTLTDNAEFCVYNVINLISNDLALINSIQKELNSVVQTGSLRLSLGRDILTAGTAIPADVSSIAATFPVCESAQLTKSLLTLTPIITSSVSCLFSG